MGEDVGQYIKIIGQLGCERLTSSLSARATGAKARMQAMRAKVASSKLLGVERRATILGPMQARSENEKRCGKKESRGEPALAAKTCSTRFLRANASVLRCRSASAGGVRWNTSQ